MNRKKCEPRLNNEYIEYILGYLQGWVLEKPHHHEKIQDEYATSFLEREDIHDALDTVQIVTRKELYFAFEVAKNEVKSYLWFDYIPDIKPVHMALCKWASGIIWKKYNVKEVELLDRTNSLGYGDQLISQAKNDLRPYIRTRLRAVV